MSGTLYLTPAWDLTTDASGNIAMATAPYAVAQDIGSAVKLFLGECWFDTTRGQPWFQQVLGRKAPLSVVKSLLEQAAMMVPNVASAIAVIQTAANRGVTGQIQATMTDGSLVTVDL